jgi:metal-dependent amidase/aminoacylase/carboxypeptidase family protein
MQAIAVCRGYQCTSTDLIKAHIIPACFAREIMGSRRHNLKISLDKVHPTQHGVFDPNILCGNCDGILGKLDDYALEVFGTYAEYDAVPGNSQQVVPHQAPRAGLHPWAAGHTDPHSALGTTSLAGVLAAKAAMERFGLSGTLLFFGEPAEKVCGSKPVHAAKGYYDGADAFISYHPHFTNTAIRDTQCGSYWSVVFTFETATRDYQEFRA